MKKLINTADGGRPRRGGVGGDNFPAEVWLEAIHGDVIPLAAYLDFEKLLAALQHQVWPPVGRR
jgi:hypothetical protein